ncbi:MAG TPA: TMEM175 family protein [Bacteroidales bacterium]|nr:TMEM175 family protein [Bacteroidales bacterium]HRZ76012.1 TMEM175 family protein [Bacteroidales bacterium]
MNNIFSKSRVEAFSDGIFAIIITLLVLEIKVPHISEHHSAQNLSYALSGLLPKFIGWLISFFTVAVIWVNHHRIFKQIKQIDQGIFWLNALLLLWTSFIPFPTAVLGDYPGNIASIVLYGAVMSLMALSFFLLRLYLIRKKGLLEESTDLMSFRTGTMYSLLFGPVAYLTGVGLGFIHPYFAFGIFLGIPLYFVFSQSRTSSSVNH